MSVKTKIKIINSIEKLELLCKELKTSLNEIVFPERNSLESISTKSRRMEVAKSLKFVHDATIYQSDVDIGKKEKDILSFVKMIIDELEESE